MAKVYYVDNKIRLLFMQYFFPISLFHIVEKLLEMSHLHHSNLAFPPILVLLKLTCLVTLIDLKSQVDHFLHF